MDVEEFTSSQLLNELYRRGAIIKIAAAMPIPHNQNLVTKAKASLEKEVFNVGAKKMQEAKVFFHRQEEDIDHMICEVYVCVSPSVARSMK
jgi:hypothetical protein